jgi:hypothetical protein
VKNKRKIDLSELKKVVALWQQVHQPVMNQVLTALHDSEHFTNFRTLVDSCLDYHRNLRLNSKKISSYVQQLVKSASGSLLTLEDEGLWNRVVNLFLENAYLRLGEAGIYFMNQLIERIPEMPDPRQSAAIRLTMDSFKRNRKKNGAVTALTLLHFKMTCDLGYFEEYNSDFEPVSWQNDYNLDLIRRLIALGMTERAERYCIQQIRGNYRDEYNVPYQILLRNMYRQEGKTSKYLEVASQLLSHFFIYEDFVAISNSFSNENEKLKWRKKVRDHAVNLSNRGNGNANAFLFTDAEAEGKFSQMSRYIKNCTPLETILHYFEKMADPNSDELLMAVFERTEYESDFFEDELIHEEERDLFPQLIEAMRTHYPKKKVLSAARRYETHRFYGQNDFIEMLFKEFKSGES